MILNMRKLLDDLKWQIEAGVDNAISEEINKKLDKKVISDNQYNNNEEILSLPGKPEESSFPKKGLEKIHALEELERFINSSDFNDFKKIAKNTIFFDGNSKSKIMVICNVPDSNEDNLGQSLVAEKGDLFDNIISSIGLSRQSLYITSIIPWKIVGNRDLSENEKIILMPVIKKHIEIIKPKIIILLGSDSLKYLLNLSDGIIKTRGEWLDYSQEDLSIPCFPILDPEFLLRRPEYKRETWSDIIILEKKIKELG
jgi:uracil-DNA glycosylase family 4